MSPFSYMNTKPQKELSAFDYRGMDQVDKVDNMSDYTPVKEFCPLMGHSKS